MIKTIILRTLRWRLKNILLPKLSSSLCAIAKKNIYFKLEVFIFLKPNKYE